MFEKIEGATPGDEALNLMSFFMRHQPGSESGWRDMTAGPI